MKKFGPYELLRRMGAGATAEVYLASGPTPHGEGLLALKIVLPHLAEDPAQRTGLLKEARTSSLLHHPHVVEIYEVGELEARPYLAMELVRGWSASALLKKLKAKGERLEVDEACELVRQAALGLDYAHEVAGPDGRPLGLVHRDVSPQNLIVTEAGEVKVVDFGLAKATASQATQTTGIKGKLPYMPPEQLKGEPLDRRADVFALGAVLWDLCCGTPLYPGTTEAEVFQQALFLPQPHPDEVAKGLPRALVEVLIRTVERDAAKRMPSAQALAQALGLLATPGAKEKLAGRIAACFEPLPHSVGEALGLPETPKALIPRPRAAAARPRRPTASPVSRPAVPKHQGQSHDTMDEDVREAERDPGATLG
ncbi:MAG: serine/threonine-protein kinase, partial [Myxococcaceae bacterium]